MILDGFGTCEVKPNGPKKKTYPSKVGWNGHITNNIPGFCWFTVLPGSLFDSLVSEPRAADCVQLGAKTKPCEGCIALGGRGIWSSWQLGYSSPRFDVSIVYMIVDLKVHVEIVQGSNMSPCKSYILSSRK